VPPSFFLRREHFAMHRLREGLAVVLSAFIFLLAAPPVHAAGLEDAIAHFTGDDYSETEAGIGAVAESGDPRAAAIIYKDADGRLLDALTGTSSPVPRRPTSRPLASDAPSMPPSAA
jgi:hypothetical protein